VRYYAADIRAVLPPLVHDVGIDTGP